MRYDTHEFSKPVYGPLPIIGIPVQVQCDGFKCMAYLDKDGQWVDLFTRKLLTHVLGVVAVGSA